MFADVRHGFRSPVGLRFPPDAGEEEKRSAFVECKPDGHGFSAPVVIFTEGSGRYQATVGRLA